MSPEIVGGVFGLAGVLVGGGLAFLTQRLSDRAVDRKQLRQAFRLIEVELADYARVTSHSLKSGFFAWHMWPRPRMWLETRADLARTLPREVWLDLRDTYDRLARLANLKEELGHLLPADAHSEADLETNPELNQALEEVSSAIRNVSDSIGGRHE